MSELDVDKFDKAPPTYFEFKSFTRDLFEKGFNAGLFRVDIKTVTSSGIEFHLLGQNEIATNYTLGSLTAHYFFQDLGATIRSEWKTSNQLYTRINFENPVLCGIRLTPSFYFEPYTGKKSGNLTASYKMEACDVTFDLESADDQVSLWSSFVARMKYPHYCCDPSGVASVLYYHNFLGGCQFALDVLKRKLTHTHLAVGYYTSNFLLHTSIEDGVKFGCSIYQKINCNLDTGVTINYNVYQNTAVSALAWRYQVSPFALLKAKVNNQCQVNATMSFKFRPEIGVSFASFVDGKGCTPWQFGIGTEFEV